MVRSFLLLHKQPIYTDAMLKLVPEKSDSP